MNESAVACLTDLDAARVYQTVCRTDFDTPGVCVISLGDATDSFTLREQMVALVREMSTLHAERSDNALGFLSASRFDQQVSTRPHLDGGPDESLLVLGYEPSTVASELLFYDYSRAAHDLRLTPREFLIAHNPMFASGMELLAEYEIRVPCFRPTDAQIVVVNNSSAPFSTSEPKWQGVLHTGTIPTPDETARRVINSTLVAPLPSETEEPLAAEELSTFLTTTAVKRRGYDKPELEDDA